MIMWTVTCIPAGDLNYADFNAALRSFDLLSDEHFQSLGNDWSSAWSENDLIRLRKAVRGAIWSAKHHRRDTFGAPIPWAKRPPPLEASVRYENSYYEIVSQPGYWGDMRDAYWRGEMRGTILSRHSEPSEAEAALENQWMQEASEKILDEDTWRDFCISVSEVVEVFQSYGMPPRKVVHRRECRRCERYSSSPYHYPKGIIPCNECDGEGYIPLSGYPTALGLREKCLHCRGTGRQRCDICNGRGEEDVVSME